MMFSRFEARQGDFAPDGRIRATRHASVPLGTAGTLDRTAPPERRMLKREHSQESHCRETARGTRRSRLRIRTAAVAMIVASLAACSARSGVESSSSDAPIKECEAFLTAYEQCLGTLGSAQVARTRAQQTRSSLAAEAERGDLARGEVRRRCVANLSQLETTCRTAAPSSAASSQGEKP
jgi:hypothetical protein